MIDKLIEQQETIKGLQNNQESLIKIMKMYENYKLRIDKAIEYIENHKKMTQGRFNGKEWVEQYFELVCNPKELLEILKGEDK